MEDFLNRLNRNPYQPIDGASVTKFDELGNGLDDWGNVIAPKFEAPQQTWGETALGVLTAPQRLAGALYDSLTPYQFPQTTSTPMNRAGAGQPITGGSGDGGWQMPPIIGDGVNALTAVGDAYTQGMSEDEMRNRALGMAGFMMGGGGLAAKPTVRAAPAQIAAKSEMDIAMENLRRAVDDDLGDKSPYWNRPLEPRDLTLYHGTGSAFDRFNTPDVWASDSADMASNWAMRKDNPSVIPLEVKGARITRPRDQTLDPEAERARALSEGYDAIDWGKFDGGHYYQLVRPGTVRSATTGETLFSNASKEGAVPGVASALVPDESGLLDFWHSSPRVFDNFDNTAAATNGGTRGITFFAEKDRAGPGGAINQNFGPNAYNAKVDPTGARILDGRLPFEQLPDDIQSVLSSNPDVVGGWKRRHGAMTFNGAPYDEANPAHYAAKLLNEVGDRQRLIQNLEAAPKRSRFERLLNGPDINEQALDIIRSGKEPTPDTFRPGVPLSDQYSMHNFNGLNLDKLGIDIAINPDEIGLLDTSRIKHLYRNGEQLYSNASKEGAAPALASALDMSPEARLARAREMGFDTSRTLYHGTDRDFESFNPSQSGAYGPGVYVTPDADYANRYAIGRSGWEQDTRIMPLHVRGDMADGTLYESLKREARASGVPDDQIAMVVQQQLQDMGYAGVEGRANQAVTVFDPSNIRSVNAAFDPAKSDSANLLAANADSKPALLAGALGQEQNVPDWLLPFLQGM